MLKTRPHNTEEARPTVGGEDGVRGQRPPEVCLDGRPPPVVNEYPYWGCGVNSGVCFGSSVSVVNGCPRWEILEYPALCTQKLGITCPRDDGFEEILYTILTKALSIRSAKGRSSLVSSNMAGVAESKCRG
ncbi:hypothetical protein AgCh_004744 [Apium graveolens]